MHLTTGEVTPVLEQQRAALLMLISALTLSPEQQLLMPGPSKPSFGATGDDLASLQSWFQAQRSIKRLKFEIFRDVFQICNWVKDG